MRVLDPNDPAEVLEAAAEVIEERGWCKGHLRTDDGRVCMQGAVLEALPADEMRVDRMRTAMEALDAFLGCKAEHWNDRAASDEDEVIDTLRKCAKDIRNGEAR